MKTTFHCDYGNHDATVDDSGMSCGYIALDGEDNDKLCYGCCAKIDRQFMADNGKIGLYMDTDKRTISNWPESLVFNARIKTSNHNMAGVRYDAWFDGPDGHVWHAVTYGDMTQIAHCKRTKRLPGEI